jgi:hypothetical protein
MLVLLGASMAAAQNSPSGPPTAPTEVEAVLRDRVTKFFEAQMNGKYRQADQYVAEDTKDFFYAMPKFPILKFEVGSIAYSDRFTKAAVTIRIDRELSQALIPKMKMHNREVTDWKIENGQWCWTVDQNVVKTPFGDMRRPAPGAAHADSAAPLVSAIPSVADMTRTVTADKTEVDLSNRKTDQVVFRNMMPGPVVLSLEAPQTPGLEAKLDRADVAPNGTAQVLFTYDAAAGGAAEGPVAVNVVVQPTQQVISIQVKLKPGGAAGK